MAFLPVFTACLAAALARAVALVRPTRREASASRRSGDHVREGPQQTAGAKEPLLAQADGGIAQGAGFACQFAQLVTQLGGVGGTLHGGQGQLQFLLIQQGVHRHGAGADHFGQGIAGGAHGFAQLINAGQLFAEADSLNGGYDQIRQEQAAENNIQPDQHKGGG